MSRSLEGRIVALLACGSYNPPTFMHLRMFERARDFLQLHHGCKVIEGIMSPVSDFFAKPDLLSASHRMKMAELAVRSSDWIRADAWECSQKQWTRTLAVLKHFKKLLNEKHRNLGNVHLMLLCGGDIVDSFTRITPSGKNLWEPSDIAEIVRDFGLVILARTNSHPHETLKKLPFLEGPLTNVYCYEDEVMPNNLSSTRLRTALRNGESIKYCTEDAVVDYILSNKLYFGGSSKRDLNKALENSTSDGDCGRKNGI
ncbi:hypothetical protein AB6A40_003118 [Gnathostoma spinigerum]|uniref:Nicotinamide-nucleotide adenylyltransferase n=1 Tax=Gnathostoma spinigerum TaxID=75299 RepID=A0ABD6E8L7_9BILA